MWKIQDFTNQIALEINFGAVGSPKPAHFAILGALNFANLVKYSIQKEQNLIKIKIQSLLMC